MQLRFVFDGRPCLLWINQDGYPCLTVLVDGRKQVLHLHRLVYELAHGPVPEGCEIHHVDRDKLNCHPSNLVALERPRHRECHRDRNCPAPAGTATAASIENGMDLGPAAEAVEALALLPGLLRP